SPNSSIRSNPAEGDQKREPAAGPSCAARAGERQARRQANSPRGDMTTRTITSNQIERNRTSMFSRLKPYLALQRAMAVLMAALLLSATGLQLFVPQLLRRFIDGPLAAAAQIELTTLAVLFLVVAVVTQLLNAVATYVAASVGWRATNHLREDLTRHTLELDM